MTIDANAYFVVYVVAIAVFAIIGRRGVVAIPIPCPEADTTRGAAGTPICPSAPLAIHCTCKYSRMC